MKTWQPKRDFGTTSTLGTVTVPSPKLKDVANPVLLTAGSSQRALSWQRTPSGGFGPAVNLQPGAVTA